MTSTDFPSLIEALPSFDGPFEARRLAADGCEVLLASYPAGTVIEAHTHETANCGVITYGELIMIWEGEERSYRSGEWYQLAPGQEHEACFEIATGEIEFWFTASV